MITHAKTLWHWEHDTGQFQAPSVEVIPHLAHPAWNSANEPYIPLACPVVCPSINQLEVHK